MRQLCREGVPMAYSAHQSSNKSLAGRPTSSVEQAKSLEDDTGLAGIGCSGNGRLPRQFGPSHGLGASLANRALTSRWLSNSEVATSLSACASQSPQLAEAVFAPSGMSRKAKQIVIANTRMRVPLKFVGQKVHICIMLDCKPLKACVNKVNRIAAKFSKKQ